MTPLAEYLLKQYPIQFALVTKFSRENPELAPERRLRGMIDTLASQPEQVKRCFKKRGGRWHIDVVAFAEMMADERPILEGAA